MKHIKLKVTLILLAVIVAVVLVLTSKNQLLTVGIIVAVILVAFAAFKIIKYMMSEYYKSTKDSYFKVLFNREKSLRYSIYKRFSKKLNGMKRCLCDVYMPKVDGTLAKADMVILNETGVWVIDIKNYSGKVSGNEADQTWTHAHGSHTEEIPNPLIWNKLYMKWLKSYAKDYPHAFYFSFAVYADTCNINDIKLKTNDANVAKLATLNKEIMRVLSRIGTSLAESELEIVNDKFKILTDETKAKELTDIQGIQETIFYNK